MGHVIKLLELCLRSTYFTFDGQIYSQVEGAAMGSPVSPIVANIFMQWFEETALETFPYEISLWKRYVDDTIVILMDALLDDLTAHINVVHPAIRFTREEEEDGSLAVLDAQISRREDMLTFSVYRKPTHTDQYLQFCSNHAAARAQARGHKDVGPSVCHYLQGQGVSDAGDTCSI